MAFQADIIMSGFATTMVGSPWTRVNVGEQHFSAGAVGMPRAGDPWHCCCPRTPSLWGWVLRRTVQTSLLPPDPVCDFPFNRLPHSETLLQAFAQTLG